MTRALEVQNTPKGGRLFKNRLEHRKILMMFGLITGGFGAYQTARCLYLGEFVNPPFAIQAVIGLGVFLMLLLSARSVEVETHVDGSEMIRWTETYLATRSTRTVDFLPHEVVEVRISDSKVLKSKVYLIIEGWDPLFMVRAAGEADRSVAKLTSALGPETARQKLQTSSTRRRFGAGQYS